MRTTAQQQADFWANEVMVGHGQWEARLCMRGITGLPMPLPPGTCVGLSLPQPGEQYDEKRRIVYGSARIMEG